ncbi:MAG: hypothetical protein M3R17_20290 [Bacteroidota bacterium]|nr:hypothetical protein [Bacteroidota bacterium]
MIRLIFAFLLLALVSCGSQEEGATDADKYNDSAVKLNDSAVRMTMTFKPDSITYMKAVELLDQASAIDSNYYLAYHHKIMFLFGAKQFDKALVASKQIVRLSPNVPESYGRPGIICEILGDSVTAHTYFQKAAELYKVRLDTMKSGTPDYDMMVMSQAVNLIMLGEAQKGNELMEASYARQTDPVLKQSMDMFRGKSKWEIIEGIRDGDLGK